MLMFVVSASVLSSAIIAEVNAQSRAAVIARLADRRIPHHHRGGADIDHWGRTDIHHRRRCNIDRRVVHRGRHDHRARRIIHRGIHVRSRGVNRATINWVIINRSRVMTVTGAVSSADGYRWQGRHRQESRQRRRGKNAVTVAGDQSRGDAGRDGQTAAMRPATLIITPIGVATTVRIAALRIAALSAASGIAFVA